MNKLSIWKPKLLAIMLLLFTLSVDAQSETAMADLMRESGKIYVVVVVLLIIFIGIIAYLLTIDKKLKDIEDKLN